MNNPTNRLRFADPPLGHGFLHLIAPASGATGRGFKLIA